MKTELEQLKRQWLSLAIGLTNSICDSVVETVLAETREIMGDDINALRYGVETLNTLYSETAHIQIQYPTLDRVFKVSGLKAFIGASLFRVPLEVVTNLAVRYGEAVDEIDATLGIPTLLRAIHCARGPVTDFRSIQYDHTRKVLSVAAQEAFQQAGELVFPTVGLIAVSDFFVTTDCKTQWPDFSYDLLLTKMRAALAGERNFELPTLTGSIEISLSEPTVSENEHQSMALLPVTISERVDGQINNQHNQMIVISDGEDREAVLTERLCVILHSQYRCCSEQDIRRFTYARGPMVPLMGLGGVPSQTPPVETVPLPEVSNAVASTPAEGTE